MKSYQKRGDDQRQAEHPGCGKLKTCHALTSIFFILPLEEKEWSVGVLLGVKLSSISSFVITIGFVTFTICLACVINS